MESTRTVSPAELLSAALDVDRDLRRCRDVEELRARAAVLACSFCGFERALVLSVGDGVLTASGTAIDHEGCDALRRRALARPIPIDAGSPEAELLRRADTGGGDGHRGGGATGEVLALEQFAMAPIVPEARAVGVVVVDRPEGQVTDDELTLVGVYATLVARAIERVVLRARLARLGAEFRHLAASTVAMGQEASTAPITMSPDLGWEAIHPGLPLPSPAAASPIAQQLTAREVEIMNLLAQGRSNRSIAEALYLSPDTVKAHVARVFRKLGVANRAEAVARYLANEP